MPNHAKCSHPWTVHTSRLFMSKNSIKNVLENLFLMFGRGKTQNRAKTHRPSMSAFSAIFVLKENGTQSHSAKFLNWGDHVNSVPDLAASPPWPWCLKTFVVQFLLIRLYWPLVFKDVTFCVRKRKRFKKVIWNFLSPYFLGYKAQHVFTKCWINIAHNVL